MLSGAWVLGAELCLPGKSSGLIALDCSAQFTANAERPPRKVAVPLLRAESACDLPLALPPVDQVAKCRGAARDGVLVCIRLVGFNLCAACFVAANCAQAQADLLLLDVDLDDLELVLKASFKLGSAVIASFGDVAKTLNALGDLNESTELRCPQHFAVDHVAHPVRGKEALPHIRLQLLDAKAQAAVLRLNAKNDGLHLLALLHN